MKRITSLIILIFFILSSFAQNSDFYYYNGKKQFLQKVIDEKFILFEASIDTNDLRRVINVSKLRFTNQGIIQDYKNIQKLNSQKVASKKWVTISADNLDKKSLVKNKQIVYESFFYRTEKGIEAGLSHLFYVKLKDVSDFEKLQSLAKKNKVKIIGNNMFMPLWYTLSCSMMSNGNSLEMANTFYETMLFEAAEPDLMTEYLPSCTNDTHFNNQWGHNNTGQYGGNGIDINFCQSRQITVGNINTVIAVLDHGFELNHPDYVNDHAISFDTETGTSPSQVRGSHGTACAGIIGAGSNNNIGISGIASGCQIMSISNNLVLAPNSPQTLADGINFAWQNDADVISNSWGHNALQSTLIDNAITNALTQGRNGLGTVVVFAAGNDDGAVSYPANSNDDIIVVGALSPCGERKSPTSCDGETTWGSNFGAELDIMAPGVLVPTSDRQGNNGYNPNIPIHTNNGGTLVTTDYADQDYTTWFNGTSAACPHVAAVAGLILSKNSHLTQLQVAEIIESTAQKVGGYNYQPTAGRPNGTWDDEVGYGLLDAFTAVQACPTTTIANETIDEDTEINGCDVNLNNVNVEYNSQLIIDAENNVEINGEFEVELGSELEIK